MQMTFLAHLLAVGEEVLYSASSKGRTAARVDFSPGAESIDSCGTVPRTRQLPFLQVSNLAPYAASYASHPEFVLHTNSYCVAAVYGMQVLLCVASAG